VNVGPAVSTTLDVIALFLLLAGAAGFALLTKGCFVLRRMARDTPRDHTASILKSPLVPSVSVVALAPDASRESFDMARRLLDLTFGDFELVVVLDGAQAAELAAWNEEFHLYLSTRTPTGDLATARVRGIYESRDPIRLVVVSKEPGGEADAWDAGVNVASSPVIGIVDRDTQADRAVLLYLMRPILEAPEETLAVCGVSAAPASGGLVGHFGALESLRTWLGRSCAFAGWNFVVPSPGSTVLIDRQAILDVGGFSGGPVDLFLRLRSAARRKGKPYRMAFVPKQVTHARVPRSLAELRQVVRHDQREVLRALWRSRASLDGVAALWWALLVFCIRFACPVAETVALLLTAVGLAMHWIDWNLAGVVLLATVAMGAVVSMGAVVLRELAEFAGSDPAQLAALFFATIPENLGYRQLSNLWMIAGLFGGGTRKNQSRGKVA
jgi:cellulose synthase/poly-beta-1,6-N-acetylglucosamine synthase-like glycosyltransferase